MKTLRLQCTPDDHSGGGDMHPAVEPMDAVDPNAVPAEGVAASEERPGEEGREFAFRDGIIDSELEGKDSRLRM